MLTLLTLGTCGVLFDLKTDTWATFDPAYTYTWAC